MSPTFTDASGRLVAERLEERMVRETEAIATLAEDEQITLRTAAYAHALRRIGAAVDARGSAAQYRDG